MVAASTLAAMAIQPSRLTKWPKTGSAAPPRWKTSAKALDFFMHKFMKSHHYSHETPHQKRVKSHLQSELKILKDVQDTTTKLTDYHE